MYTASALIRYSIFVSRSRSIAKHKTKPRRSGFWFGNTVMPEPTKPRNSAWENDWNRFNSCNAAVITFVFFLRTNCLNFSPFVTFPPLSILLMDFRGNCENQILDNEETHIFQHAMTKWMNEWMNERMDGLSECKKENNRNNLNKRLNEKTLFYKYVCFLPFYQYDKMFF